MAAPTPALGIGGLLALASPDRPPTFTMTDSARWFRRRLASDPCRALRNPDRRRGRQVCPMRPRLTFGRLRRGCPGEANEPQDPVATPMTPAACADTTIADQGLDR